MSSRTPVPSERRCTAEGIPYVNATQHNILASLAAADRVATLPTIPESTESAFSVATDDDLAALEAELAYQTKVFAAIPDNFENEHPTDPVTYSEAMNSEHATEWTQAMRDEFNSLRDLGVYKLVPRSTVPAGRKIMRGRPVFKLKHDQNGDPARFKARYVCRGYSAIWGQDYMTFI